MHRNSLFFVGTQPEIAHHAKPLMSRLPLQVVPPEEVTSIAQPGDVAVFYSEHFDRFRHAIMTLKQNQVATLYMIDGILEWRNAWENRDDEPACPFTMRPVLSHKVACIGSSQARILSAWGNQPKIEVTGVPRFDHLIPSPISLAGDENIFRVLIVTAKVPGFTPIQVARTRQSLFDLKHWFDRNKEKQFSGRKIEFHWRLTAGLERDLQIENQLGDFNGSDLFQQLQTVDAMIATHSTAMLEGMLAGLPVACLDYQRCPNYLETAWTITQAEMITEVMEELAQPPESKLFFQRMQLEDALAFAPVTQRTTTATDRLTTLIQSMQRLAVQCIAAEKELHFPPRLLADDETAMNAVPARMNHRAVFQKFPEFDVDDRVELQSELAHARREIAHLNRVLSQKQAELDLAHSIFAQIHKHPVAGPIVRMRQRFLDWFNRNQPCQEPSP